MVTPCRPKKKQVKKNDHDILSKAEQRRYEDIVRIQTMLKDGYAPVQIKEILHTSYSRIRRYATGDPLKLCRFIGDKVSEADQYRDEIITLLTQNMLLKQVLEHVSTLGYQGKKTAFYTYCRKLVVELGIAYKPRRNVAGVQIDNNLNKPEQHYVSKSDFEKYLWSGKELNPADIDFIFSKYPQVSEIRQCILDFRKIYDNKEVTFLERFIALYSENQSKPIKSFASGLRSDLAAVKNSVTSELSNGFVEGNNNKIKAIKRMMYGRAKIDLLRVKVLYAR
jgi:hypothetical protein